MDDLSRKAFARMCVFVRACVCDLCVCARARARVCLCVPLCVCVCAVVCVSASFGCRFVVGYALWVEFTTHNNFGRRTV